MIDINLDRSERVKYDYPDFPVYIRWGVLSHFPNYAAESHWHDDIELIAVLKGQMLYNINGQVITLNEGEGILVNSKQFHYGFSETKTECLFICILFHPILLCASKMFESRFIEPVLNSELPYIHLSPEIPWKYKVLNCIREIFEKRDEKTSPLNTQGMIYLLWNEVAANLPLNTKTIERADTKLTTLKKMISYIWEHYGEKITLEDIAAAGHISKRTCGSVFLKYLNKTPIEFLTDYRLRKSIEFMKGTDITILEISLAAGFSGASYYAETFRKYFGKSPAEYRKNLK